MLIFGEIMDKKEFEKYLRFKHQSLFGLCIGVSVDQGWQKIVKLLCENIQERMDDRNIAVSISQIKEKFGKLRIYHISDDPYICGLVAMAQNMANSTCEVCGTDGELVLVGKEIRTLCPDHAAKFEEANV